MNIYSTSTNGKEWSVSKVVLSTDYSFAASAAQDEALKDGIDVPLGTSAYYSGRAYGPAVVQNPGGSPTMVFSSDGAQIPGCESQPLGLGTPDVATCVAPSPRGARQRDDLRRLLRGLNYSTSAGDVTETLDEAPAIAGGLIPLGKRIRADGV